MEVIYIAQGTFVIHCCENNKNIANVHICIWEDTKKDPVFETATGIDGKTEKILLQTPKKEISFQQGKCPYGSFHITCSKKGYTCMHYKNIQIFPEVHSYLRVEMKKEEEEMNEVTTFPHHHLFVEDNNA